MSAYDASVRLQARELWLEGGRTDAQVAALVGVARVDTVRDWRRAEDWDGLRRAVDVATARRREAEAQDARATLNRRHDQLGEAVESLVVRAMKSSQTPRAGEVRALAGALLIAQRIRRTALGLEDGAPLAAPNPLRPFPVTFVRRSSPVAAATLPGARNATPVAPTAGTAPGAASPAPR